MKKEMKIVLPFYKIAYAVSFVVMACHNEKDLFNKIMMVNPVSLSSLKQMPGKKEKLLRRCLEIPVFGCNKRI